MNNKFHPVHNAFNLVFFLCIVLLARLGVAGDPIKVMSFNIRFGTANDGDNRWENRKDLVIKTIQDYSPDLLGTQETLKFQAEVLKQNLKGYTSFGRSREQDPKKGEQCTVFFRTSRFELVDKGQFWLSETPEETGSKSWDSSLPRIATWLKLRDKTDGKEFYFLNTHFDHRGKTARWESAKLISRKTQAFAAPCIVTGDFNCGEASKPYLALLKNEKFKLIDSYRKAHPTRAKAEGTFNGFRGTDSGARIDWVLHTPEFSTYSAKINKSNQQGRYPSDHFPVTAVLQLK